MEKGLCISCVQDSGCSFARRFPVLFCEEFQVPNDQSKTSGKTAVKKAKACAVTTEELVD